MVGAANSAGIHAQDHLIFSGNGFGKFLNPELSLGE
jgi:hypothetical protein